MQSVRLARLISYIIRNGKFRHSGYDPVARRQEIAQALRQFAPATEGKRPWALSLRKRSYLRTWIAEAAYFKNSFKCRAGHLSLHDAGIAYIRIPKSASTSLCKTVLEARFPDLRPQNISPEQVNALADSHLEKTISTDSSPDVLFFTLVRNPFSRMVSVYREYFESNHKPFLYEDYLFGILRQDFTFRKFVDVVERIPDRLKDQHLKPQCLFLRYYERRSVQVRAFRLESPGELDVFLRSRGLTFEVVNQSKARYDYRDYYDEHSFRAVSRIYREDILRFGYGRDMADLKSTIEQRHVHN